MGYTHEEALSVIRETRLVAILRGVPAEKADGVVAALLAGGVRVLEFTFDHTRLDCVAENAEKIRRAVLNFGHRAGAGCAASSEERPCFHETFRNQPVHPGI